MPLHNAKHATHLPDLRSLVQHWKLLHHQATPTVPILLG